MINLIKGLGHFEQLYIKYCHLWYATIIGANFNTKTFKVMIPNFMF